MRTEIKKLKKEYIQDNQPFDIKLDFYEQNVPNYVFEIVKSE